MSKIIEKIEELANRAGRGEVIIKEELGITDGQMEAMYAIAYNQFQNTEFDAAAKSFSLLCMFDPFEYKYIFGIASCFHMKGEHELASMYYVIASGVDEKDPAPFFHTAECLLATNDKEGARDALALTFERAVISPQFSPLRKQAELLLKRLALDEETNKKIHVQGHMVSENDTGESKKTFANLNTAKTAPPEHITGQSSAITSGPSLSPPSGTLDFSGAKEIFAQLEDLTAIFQQMSLNNKKVSYEIPCILTKFSTRQGSKNEEAISLPAMTMISLLMTIADAALYILTQQDETQAEGITTGAACTLKTNTKESVKAALDAMFRLADEGNTKNVFSPEILKPIFDKMSESMQPIGYFFSRTYRNENETLQPAMPSEQKTSINCAANFREAMKTMNESLYALHDAQIIAEEAASKA